MKIYFHDQLLFCEHFSYNVFCSQDLKRDELLKWKGIVQDLDNLCIGEFIDLVGILHLHVCFGL